MRTANCRAGIAHQIRAWGAKRAVRTAVAVISLAASPAALRAEQPERFAPLEYRRYFVPADRPQAWPRGKASYLPIEADEFERLVEAANSTPLGKAALSAARVSKAVYRAALEGPDRLTGEARFEISAPDDSPVLMPLTPLGFVVEGASWEGPPEDAAVVGVDAEQRFSVLVERAGTLVVRWSHTGRRNAAGSLEFGLELPRAPLARVQIELPPGITPEIATGVLADDAPAGNCHRWEFELGGRAESTLVLTPDETQSRHRRLTLLQQHADYRFTPGGLELTAQLRLDVYHKPLRRIELDLEGGLRIVAAQHGGKQVAWSNADSQAEGASRPVLEFAEPLLGPGRSVTVTAVAPLVFNQSWTLPRLRVQGVVWQEGSASLAVAAPLSLDQLLPLRCRQSKSGPLASARPGDAFDLQFFSPDASAKVNFSWRQPLVNLAAATRVGLSADSWHADFRGQFEAREGENFVLSANIAEGWLVESVISVPPGAVSTWSIEEAGDGRTLVVQLAEPLSPSRPIALRIGGRRSAAIDQPVSDAALQMLEFRGVAVVDRLLALAPDGPYRLVFDGVEQPRSVRFGDLSPEQRKLIGMPSSDAWIDLQAAHPRWTATLASQAPRYSGEILVDALLAENRLIETCTIRCKPDGAKLDRVMVYFGQSRSNPPHWTVDGDRGPLVAKRLPPDDEVAPAGTAAGPGETWEVRLARPTQQPFVVRAERETDWNEESLVGLVALDGAASQQGNARIRVAGPIAEIAASRRLTPVPLGSAAFDDSAADDVPPIAAYHYDPLVELGAPPPAIQIRRASWTSAAAVVWKLDLRSEYSASGRVSHTAQLHLQNKGQRHCSFRLPGEVEIVAVRIGNTEVTPEVRDGLRLVELPKDQEFSALSVEYSTKARPLGLVGRCHSVWPEIDLPVMSRSWTLAVPPPYILGHEFAEEGQFNWRQRLFGPLGRAVGEAPFDPRQIDGWQSLAVAARGAPPSSDERAWNHYTLMFEGDSPAGAWFVHSDAVAVARWAIVAIVVGLALSLRCLRPAILVALGAAAGVAALWLPAVLAPLASGVWLGALASLIGRLLLSPRGHSLPKTHPVSDISATVPTAAIGAALCAIAFAIGPVRAADDEVPVVSLRAGVDEPKDDAVHRVLIPVDARGKPGARYQVPTDFLQALRRCDGATEAQPRGWLLTEARYECALGSVEEASRIEVTELSVEYRLRVFDGDTQVRLPLLRERAALIADSATLDRQPIELSWDDTGQALLCDVDEPGDYPLRFRLAPQTDDRGETTGFELMVPRVASSRLEIAAPPEAMPIEVGGARGAVKPAVDGRRVSAELGPAGQWSVRWSQRLSAAAPVAEVDELLWLKVRPGSVVLDARLDYRVQRGLLRRVELATDHRLWRIPGGEEALPPFTERTLPGDPLTSSSPQLVQFDLESPVRDRLSLDLSWLLTGSSGVGNLRLPAFQVLGARATRRWLAVTVDVGLEYDIHNGERLEGLPPAEFAAAWGGPDASVLRDALVYRLNDAETAWSLATRPREPQTTVKEELVLSFDRAGATVRYEAQLRTTAGFVFAHRLSVPEELQIEQVSLEEEGVERAARWGRGEPGVVTVFLNRRVTGAQRLSLRGRLPLPSDGRLPLPEVTFEPGDPDVTIERAEVLSRTLRIYRQPAVAVSLSGVRGLTETDEPGGDASSRPLGRLVAQYDATGGFAAALTVTANEPAVRSVAQLTSLNYLDRSWTAQCDVRFTVDDGVLDAVRFDVPANWTGPFEMSPAGTIEMLTPPGADRVQLLVRPRVPFKGRASLTLQARLKPMPGDAVAAPDVAVLLPDAERFVALPLSIGLEPVSWDTARLVASPLPESLAGARPLGAVGSAKESVSARRTEAFAPSEAIGVYRVAGESPQAVLNTTSHSRVAARVRLADIALSRDEDTWQAAAAFDLDPGGGAVCPLQLPKDWRLLEVWIEGVAAAPRRADDGQWQLSLHSAHLPQRIEVVAVGPAAQRHLPQLAPISLGDLPVQETLLTVSAPRGRTPIVDSGDVERCDAAACAGVRVESAAATIDLPQETVATTPSDDLLAWFRPWALRLIEARQAQLSVTAAAPDKPVELNDRWLAAARRLRAEPLLKSLAAAPRAASQPLQLWSEAHRDRPLAHYRLRGGAMPLAWRTNAKADLGPRLISTTLLVVIALMTLALGRQPATRDAWRRWPQLLLAAAGLCWWLWLQPSALGLVLMAVGVLSAFRSAWNPAWGES